MSEKRFVLSYYKNADRGIHIQKIRNSEAARAFHSHEYFQIYYVAHGALTHETESGASRLSRGDCFIIPPGRSHRISALEDALFYTFSFTKESLALGGQIPPLLVRFLQDLEAEDKVRTKISLQSDAPLFTESLLDKMHGEFCEKPLGYGDILGAYATALLTILARHYYEDIPLTVPPSSNRARMLYCIEYMEQNFSEPLKLSDMARWTAMSKTAFCKQFAALTGTTFLRYLHGIRIKHAVALMEKEYKLHAIAGLCGYNDFSTFHRNFKEVMGCSPEQYRQNMNTVNPANH